MFARKNASRTFTLPAPGGSWQKRAPAHSIKHSAGRTIYFFLKLLRVSRREAGRRVTRPKRQGHPSFALSVHVRQTAAAKFPAFEGVNRVSWTAEEGSFAGSISRTST